MRAMPKTLDIQGFSGLREEVVRSQSCPSRTSVLQALTRLPKEIILQSALFKGFSFGRSLCFLLKFASKHIKGP